MRRIFIALLIAVGPLLALTAIGCHKEIRTYSESERVQESEPQMVSPGEPVVE